MGQYGRPNLALAGLLVIFFLFPTHCLQRPLTDILETFPERKHCYANFLKVRPNESDGQNFTKFGT